MDLGIEGRPVLLDLTQDVLEHLKRHQAGIGRRLDDIIGGEVATRTGRATKITGADDIDPISERFGRFYFQGLVRWLINRSGVLMTHITQFDNRRRSSIEIKISPHKF